MSNLTNDPISQDALHFARRATAARVYASVLSVFIGRCQNCGFSIGELAKRLGKPAADIAELMDQPDRWSLDTVSDLLLAMGCEMAPRIQELLFTNTEAQTALLVSKETP